jgi:hypothetical protein
MPWLPSAARPRAFGDGAKERRGVVLSLRRKKGRRLRKSQSQDSGLGDGNGDGDDAQEGGIRAEQGNYEDGTLQDWARGSNLDNDNLGGAGSKQKSRSSSISAGRGGDPTSGSGSNGDGGALAGSTYSNSSLINPWRDPTPVPDDRSSSGTGIGRGRINTSGYDAARRGVISDEERNVWGDDPSSEDDVDEDDDEEDDRGGIPPESPVSRLPVFVSFNSVRIRQAGPWCLSSRT